MALWRGVNLCGDIANMGFRRVVFEGDSLNVVSAMCQDNPCWSSYGQLIEDTRIRFHSLQFYAVRNVDRATNKVAHSLAKMALNRSLDYVWVEEYLSSIRNIVLAKQIPTILINVIHVFQKKYERKKEDILNPSN